MASGKVVATLKGHQDFVKAVVFAPDGAWLASADDGTVLLWRVHSAKQHASLDGQVGRGRVTGLAFSPDSKMLALGSDPWPAKGAIRRSSGQIKLWDVATATELASFRPPRESVVRLAFRPDGTRLAAAGDEGRVAVWSLSGIRRPPGKAR